MTLPRSFLFFWPFLLLWSLCPTLVQAASRPPVQLVDVYQGNLNLTDFWVSEKYDGVRGYWDGKRMLTRSGSMIQLPDWFTRDLPDQALDGELWAGYDDFSLMSRLARTAGPEDPGWEKVSYQIFDMPDHAGIFDERIPDLYRLVERIDRPWIKAVKQFRLPDEKALYEELDSVVAKGGEGLVLHQGSRIYTAGRNAGLFKLKPYDDAEARVIGYRPGKGRLEGMMGALLVRLPDGRELAIGTGFTDTQRQAPPPIGSWITFRYQGLTTRGLPRFARFLRPRPGGPPPEVEPTSEEPEI